MAPVTRRKPPIAGQDKPPEPKVRMGFHYFRPYGDQGESNGMHPPGTGRTVHPLYGFPTINPVSSLDESAFTVLDAARHQSRDRDPSKANVTTHVYDVSMDDIMSSGFGLGDTFSTNEGFTSPGNELRISRDAKDGWVRFRVAYRAPREGALAHDEIKVIGRPAKGRANYSDDIEKTGAFLIDPDHCGVVGAAQTAEVVMTELEFAACEFFEIRFIAYPEKAKEEPKKSQGARVESLLVKLVHVPVGSEEFERAQADIHAIGEDAIPILTTEIRGEPQPVRAFRLFRVLESMEGEAARSAIREELPKINGHVAEIIEIMSEAEIENETRDEVSGWLVELGDRGVPIIMDELRTTSSETRAIFRLFSVLESIDGEEAEDAYDEARDIVGTRVDTLIDNLIYELDDSTQSEVVSLLLELGEEQSMDQVIGNYETFKDDEYDHASPTTIERFQHLVMQVLTRINSPESTSAALDLLGYSEDDIVSRARALIWKRIKACDDIDSLEAIEAEFVRVVNSDRYTRMIDDSDYFDGIRQVDSNLYDSLCRRKRDIFEIDNPDVSYRLMHDLVQYPDGIQKPISISAILRI